VGESAFRKLAPRVLAAGLALAASAPAARAAIIYSNSFPDAGPIPGGAASLLDDISLPAGTAPETVRSMDVGFHNYSPNPVDVDVLVTFWDNMNLSANSSQNVNSTSLGTIRYHHGVVPGGGEGTTGLFNLPTPVALPDNNLGVQIDYVLTGTNTLAPVAARIVLEDPTVGTSSSRFWSDDNPPDNSFRGGNTGSGEEVTGANLYLVLNTTVVPEPTGLAALGLAGLILARRRRA
jgi:hypothetical protein